MALPGLTNYEMLARDHFMGLMTDGVHDPIQATTNVGLPSWFDEQKFDLGREYFMKNRFGILNANLCGLVLLLSIPKGLSILRATNQSNPVSTSRQRYLDTIMHTLSWYEVQLKSGSRSWDSLQKVRRQFIQASNVGQNYQLGSISQAMLSMTSFGFVGLPLIRPYLFGIEYSRETQRDRKAFLHFWAVLNHLMGVKERYNIGLLPIKSAEIVFDIIMRNFLAPYIQLETVAFKQMTTAMLKELNVYLDNTNYESQMFLVKRAVGVPGYQVDVNFTREVPYGNILSKSDVQVIRQNFPRFSEKLQVYSVYPKGQRRRDLQDCQKFNSLRVDPFDLKALNDFDSASMSEVKKLMGLPCQSDIGLTEADRGRAYLRFLSGRKISTLSKKSRYNVEIFLALVSLMKDPRGVNLANQISDSQIEYMRTGRQSMVLRAEQVLPRKYIRSPGVY